MMIKKSFILFFLLFSGLSSGFTQEEVKSPFNGLKLKDTASYSFIVSGHFYGSDKNQSGLPANTLLGNLDWLNDKNPQMLVCLGDLFKDIRTNIPNYERVLFKKLEMPLFNTVGNHDLSDEIYQENYGKTDFSFRCGDDVHIFLDTETSNGDITELQHELIKSAEGEVSSGVNNIFIYSHRTIWKKAYEEMDEIFYDNTQSMSSGNFKDETLPYLHDLSKKADIYWMSGSLGTAPASFFYHKDGNITYIATAIRELPRDAVLEVDVDNGEVSFETHSLTGQSLEKLDHYDVDFWSTTSAEEPYSFKMAMYHLQIMLGHRMFWYGALWTSIAFLIVFLIRRKRAKKV